MSLALGFISQKHNTFYSLNFNPSEKPNNSFVNESDINHLAEYFPSIFTSFPKEICLNCNIVNQIVVGDKVMRCLSFVSTISKEQDEIMSFYMKTNDKSKLETKSFDSIHIKLTDINGELLQCENPSTPTLVNLLFSVDNTKHE